LQVGFFERNNLTLGNNCVRLLNINADIRRAKKTTVMSDCFFYDFLLQSGMRLGMVIR
jgi:hypothetical protein